MILKYKCTENNELFVGTEKPLGQTEKERKCSMNCGSQEVLSSFYITKNFDNFVEKVNFRNSLAEHWQTQELVMTEKLKNSAISVF